MTEQELAEIDREIARMDLAISILCTIGLVVLAVTW